MKAVALLALGLLGSCMQRSEPSNAAASAGMLLPQQGEITLANRGYHNWGYIDLAGILRIKEQFDVAGPFVDDLAVVCYTPSGWFAKKKPAGYGFIKRSGEYLVEPQFDDARSFKNGFAAIEVGRKWGFIDRTGKVVIPAEYDAVDDFEDGLAPAVIGGHGRNGTWGYLEPSGRWAIEPKFDAARPFSEGLAAVWTGAVWSKPDPVASKVGGAWGYIDRTGTLVIPAKFHEVQAFHEGLAVAADIGTWPHGYLDRSGQWKILPQFGHSGSFENGRAVVQVTDETKRPRKPRWGVIDTEGRFVIELKFSELGFFHEGLAHAREYGGMAGFIDESGRWAIEPRFLTAGDFSEGLAVVSERVNGGFGYIDRTGKLAIQPIFAKASAFRNGVARVDIHDRTVYVTRDGRILPPSAAKP